VRPEDLSGDAVIGLHQSGFQVMRQLSGTPDCTNDFHLKTRYLPMIEQKKTSELIETSLICLLSAGVAIGAFLLMWLLAVLTGVA
jgi:hypothetical protein